MNNIYRFILLYIAPTSIILIVVYGVYQFNAIKNENEKLKTELAGQDTQVISREDLPTVSSVSGTTTAEEISVTESKENTSDLTESKPEQKIVYIEKPVIVNEQIEEIETTNTGLMEENSQAKTEEMLPVVSGPETNFSVVAIRQASYPDGLGGTYGAYEMEIAISTDGTDILVPPTTSNTIGTGNIGFSYSVVGDNFRGIQDSQVNCSLKQNDYCKIKNDGKVRTITVTIFLYPDQDSSSNYAVNFEKMYYYQDGVRNEYSIGRQTAPISIVY